MPQVSLYTLPPVRLNRSVPGCLRRIGMDENVIIKQPTHRVLQNHHDACMFRRACFNCTLDGYFCCWPMQELWTPRDREYYATLEEAEKQNTFLVSGTILMDMFSAMIQLMGSVYRSTEPFVGSELRARQLRNRDSLFFRFFIILSA